MRAAIKAKAQRAEELQDLVEKHKVIGVANLSKVRAQQLQELVRKFRSQVLFKVAKNVLITRALLNSQKPNIDRLSADLVGSNVLLLTDMNPFALSIQLGKSKVRLKAKTGDIAPEDIVIKAGNTGLPPGPAISELSRVGVRTRIQTGSVWVLRDTTVAKAGEAITADVASILSKLDIKPLNVSLQMVAAYDSGAILSSEQLVVDLDGYRSQLEEGVQNAVHLSLGAYIPTSATIDQLLHIAHQNARSVSITAAFPASEVLLDLLVHAHAGAQALASNITWA
jgi:large subunit ribosomal protein L10